MTELTDTAARERIRRDTGATLFVEAGAGSGKTASLVDRVLTLVVDDDVRISSIAAVTFTEKAGAELRDRLRRRLEGVLGTLSAEPQRARAVAALDDLDAAAFGTLHSFAQRVLMMFPIQAELPPLIEVLDEVGSSIAFDARWSALQRRLLDDETMSEVVLLALASGVSWENVRSLTRALGSDWDLIQERVMDRPAPELVAPDTESILRQAVLLGERAGEVLDQSDRLLPFIRGVAAWAERFRTAGTDAVRLELLRNAASMKGGNVGVRAGWQDSAGVKADFKAFKEEAARLVAQFGDSTLRPIAYWLAKQVLTEAQLRRESGRLEFHDLLVLARELVRRDGEVRAQLQASFPRILLDEFQDTDPIQIELAVRIAAGAAGGAPLWEDVDVPDGSLFIVGDPKQSIYRFRRASIETYLRVQHQLGEMVALTSNFRSTPSVLDWVNAVFSSAITPVPGAQPAYRALDAQEMPGGPVGPSVTVLGAGQHMGGPSADTLRGFEADDVVASIRQAIADGWTIRDSRTKEWRAAELGDIVVLVPTRTSLPALQAAFERADLPYRAESSSLVYQAMEVRELMVAARAIADPSNEFALVTALRSSLFSCGDDDLFEHRQRGGRFGLFSRVPEGLQDHIVTRSITELRELYRASRELTPAEVLDRLLTDRRMLEVAQSRWRPRDRWRRLRFVVDQARAWSDQQHGGLREYLAWAERQADDSARVAEAVLPETDLNVVRIMTIHAAKGLEFPIVILSGMSTQPQSSRGVQVLWHEDGFAAKLTSQMQTNDFAAYQPIDEQMDDFERNRLLYVGATRARDHLVVSLHRKPRGAGRLTAAWILAEAGAVTVAGTVALEVGRTASPTVAVERTPDPMVEFDAWQRNHEAAIANANVVAARSASGLEGTDPVVVLATVAEREERAGAAKGARDVQAPPWSKGRYGSMIGRAVHGVLQTIDLAAPERLDAVIAAQATAEGVSDHISAVGGFVRSALACAPVREASESEHWREAFVATTDDAGVLHGYIDLVFRRSDGTLVVVDYKTDTVPDAAIPARVVYYTPQLRAYASMLHAATGATVELLLCFLDHTGAEARVEGVLL